MLPRSLLGVLGRGHQIAVHRLPAAEAQVETLFVRRHDAYLSSALAAFVEWVRSGTAAAAAAE